MEQPRILISVVDDDESIREALPELLQVLGFEAQTFDCAEAFLSSAALEGTRCLILDVSLPGMSGPQLQRELRLHKPDLPIIFITAQIDPALRATVLAAGAVACLIKPFSAKEWCSALDEALDPLYQTGQISKKAL
jgi:FixJ family two-component response regulator